MNDGRPARTFRLKNGSRERRSGKTAGAGMEAQATCGSCSPAIRRLAKVVWRSASRCTYSMHSVVQRWAPSQFQRLADRPHLAALRYEYTVCETGVVVLRSRGLPQRSPDV